MNVITFDTTCARWVPNRESNISFLNMTIGYLRGLHATRGYIYLNQIYEAFGARWNPDWKNICYKTEEGMIWAEIQEGLGDVWFIKIAHF